MNRNLIRFVKLLFIMMVFAGCRTHWTQSASTGNVTEQVFLESIPFEFDSKLIIIPVSIQGNSYRFLYDTGAPFSISKELQDIFTYKVVSKSKISDSDNNRSEVNWVLVDTFKLGETSFYDFSAFVGDFKQNPILACFNIDGIIGSNNIRTCNWFIDYENEIMHFTNQLADTFQIEGAHVPFTFNNQFTMELNLKFGQVDIENVHLDTGSNGDLTLLSSQFDSIAKYNQVNQIYSLSGVKQSGILGQVTPVNSKYTQLDSVNLGDLVIPNAIVGTGTSKLLGNEILSRYHLIIDSQSRQLILKKNKIAPEPFSSFGFRPGSNDGMNVFVQSVFSDSPSSKAGVLPNMQILNYDSLDFNNRHDICDFVEYNKLTKSKNHTSILTVRTENGDTITYELDKKEFFK